MSADADAISPSPSVTVNVAFTVPATESETNSSEFPPISALVKQRHILHNRHQAVSRIDGDCKGSRISPGIGNICASIIAVIATDDEAVSTNKKISLPAGSFNPGINRAARWISATVGERQRIDLRIRYGRTVGSEADAIDLQSRTCAARITQRQTKNTVRIMTRIPHAIEDWREQDVVVVTERCGLQTKRFIMRDTELLRSLRQTRSACRQ